MGFGRAIDDLTCWTSARRLGMRVKTRHSFPTLAVGSLMTGLMNERVSLLLPVNWSDVLSAIEKLRIYRLIEGYQGKSGANVEAICEAVDALQFCVMARASEICEIEIIPLICTH